MREEAIEAWSIWKEQLKLEDIDCDGCTIGRRLHTFCQVCDVRKCGLPRGIENCAYCGEFPCGKLERLWSGMIHKIEVNGKKGGFAGDISLGVEFKSYFL